MFFLQLLVNYGLLRSPGVVCETAIGYYLHGSLRSVSLVTDSATASVAAVSYLFSSVSASLIPKLATRFFGQRRRNRCFPRLRLLLIVFLWRGTLCRVPSACLFFRHGKRCDLSRQGGYSGVYDSLTREWDGADVLQSYARCGFATRISWTLCMPLQFTLAHARGQDLGG